MTALPSQQEKHVSKENDPITSASTMKSPSVPAESSLPSLRPTDDILRCLARQVEYYFSTQNLAKDTYVATLRSLNDGYVPISIISNFGKVRSLVPYAGLEAARVACIEFSELLEVVFINADTGKKILSTDDFLSAKVVEAIGPISGEPIPAASIQSESAPVVTPNTAAYSLVQNTVVIREVPAGTQEEDIRALFQFENCPSIESVNLDVANCWFVKLNTTSRETMLEVVFSLRKQTFPTGEAVMARVKSGVVSNRDTVANASFFQSEDHTKQVGARSGNSKKQKRRKNTGNNKNKSRTNNGSQSKNNKQKGAVATRRNNANKQKRENSKGGKDETKQKPSERKKTNQQALPPSFGDEQFPALPTDSALSMPKKVEVEKVPTHDEMGQKGSATSDTSSTATTSTSSSKSPQSQVVTGGYAAALRKAAAPQAPKPLKKKVSPPPRPMDAKDGQKRGAGEKSPIKQQLKAKETSREDLLPVKVTVQPPSWGHGSFADILRTRDNPMTTAES